MKIEDMTHEEIVALDSDALGRLIKLEMAVQGLPILDEPVEPPCPDLPEPDRVMYTAGVLDELCFSSSAECQTVISLIKASDIFRRRHDYSVGCGVVYPKYSNEYGDNESSFEIQQITGRSVSQFSKIKSVLMEHKTAKDEYNKELNAYKASIKGADNIRADVYSVFREHVAIDRKKEYLAKKFEQYLDLAEGNEKVAMNFLEKVETLSDDERAMLLDKSDTNTLEEYK